MRRLAWEDPAVNEDWNCDKGRFAFSYLKTNRLTQPKVRTKDGNQVDALWPDAIDFAAKGLKDAKGNNLIGNGGLVTISSTLGSVSAVVNNNNGTYTAILTGGITAGTAIISFTINGAMRFRRTLWWCYLIFGLEKSHPIRRSVIRQNLPF